MPGDPPLERTYTTQLPILEHYPDSYETWTTRLEGTTVLSQRVKVARAEDVEDAWDEDAYAPAEPVRTEHTHADAASARETLRRLIARELPRRFVASADPREALVVGPPPIDVETTRWIRTDECRPEPFDLDEAGRRLLTAAAAEPEDVGRSLVFADWLAGRADASMRALGELTVLHHAMMESGADPRRLDRARALLETHADEWLSGLVPYARVGFRLGLLDSLELLSGDAFAATTGGPELGALLSLPIASALRRLVLGPVGPVSISGNPFIDLGELVAALASAAPASLRELVIGGSDESAFSLSTDSGDLSLLWTTLPSLERVDVHGFVPELGQVRGRRLVHLGIHDPCGDDEVRSIARADLPSLRSLVVNLYGREEQLQMLAPLFEGSGVPELRRLTVRLTYSPPWRVLDLLADTPLLERLDVLEVVSNAGRGGYTADEGTDDAGFDRVLASPLPFRHLTMLKLVRTTLGHARRAELARALPNVVLA